MHPAVSLSSCTESPSLLSFYPNPPATAKATCLTGFRNLMFAWAAVSFQHLDHKPRSSSFGAYGKETGEEKLSTPKGHDYTNRCILNVTLSPFVSSIDVVRRGVIGRLKSDICEPARAECTTCSFVLMLRCVLSGVFVC